MRLLSCSLLAALVLAIAVSSIEAQIIGRAISTDPDLFVSFNQPDPDYDISGDMFGIRSRDFPDAPDCLTCPGLPFTIVDATFDLFDPFPTDRLGLIRSEDFGPFFGVVDIRNDSNDQVNSASWTFDIAGFANLRVSTDMAAMGDFEAGNIERPTQDAYVFDYSIDGGPFEILFESSVDTEISQDYEMELPDLEMPIITLDDPLAVNGVMLNNIFQTLSADVTGAGRELEIRFRALTDGGEEAFAFRNLIVEAMDSGGGSGSGIDGDYNSSGTVEQGDLDLVLLNWGSSGPVPAAWTNNLPSGAIDQGELDGVLLNWGTSGANIRPIVAVPEPSALVITLIFLLLACEKQYWAPARRVQPLPRRL